MSMNVGRHQRGAERRRDEKPEPERLPVERERAQERDDEQRRRERLDERIAGGDGLFAGAAAAQQDQVREDRDVVVAGDHRPAGGTLGPAHPDWLVAREPVDHHVEKRADDGAEAAGEDREERYDGRIHPAASEGSRIPDSASRYFRPARSAPVRVIEDRAARARPSGRTRRHAGHDPVRLHVARDDRPGTDHRAAPERDPADDRRVRADRGAILDHGRLVGVLAFHFGARRLHVGEDGRRPDETAGADVHALVDRDVVLDLGTVADRHVATDKHVLSEDAACADARARHQVAEMPDSCARPDHGAIVDDRGRMDHRLLGVHAGTSPRSRHPCITHASHAEPGGGRAGRGSRRGFSRGSSRRIRRECRRS